MSDLDEFLSGNRPDSVAIFLAQKTLDTDGRLAELGEPVDGGVVLVVPGDQGRRAFQAGTGTDAMEFAQSAMGQQGTVAPRLDGGTCPDDGDDVDHAVQFVFAFTEEQNEAVGGLYAEGDVVHAYAHCTCGTDYSQRWVVGRRDAVDSEEPGFHT